MLTKAKFVIVCILAFASLLLMTGYCLPKNEYYLLSVVNNTLQTAKVTVSLAEGTFTVDPQSSRTFRVGNQSNIDKGDLRTFTITTTDGKTEEIQSHVDYSGNVIVDVTGNSCLFAVDYGPQYRPADVSLEPGQPDILIKATIKNDRKVLIRPIMAEEVNGRKEFIPIDTEIGETLPQRIKTTPGKMPSHIRFMNVPCSITTNQVALYTYLNTH